MVRSNRGRLHGPGGPEWWASGLNAAAAAAVSAAAMVDSFAELLAMDHYELWRAFQPYRGLVQWGLLIVLTRVFVPRLLLTAEAKGWLPARGAKAEVKQEQGEKKDD